MFRFIAVARLRHDGRPPSAAVHPLLHPARLAAAGWTRGFASPSDTRWSVEVWQRGAARSRHRTLTLADRRGAIIGKIFAKAGATTLPRDATAPSSTGRSIDPDRLCSDFWGQFVAIVANGEDLHVARDASGALPCYHTMSEGSHLFFSDVNDVIPVFASAPSINTDFQIAFAMSPGLTKRITGIDQVDLVLPGERWTLSPGGRSSRMIWNPWASVHDPLTDADEAKCVLRNAVLSSTRQLAAPHARLLHSLGGLDSSIVLSALHTTASVEVEAVNGYTATAGGDERDYARAACDHAHVRLHEAFLDAGRVDLARVLDWRMQPVPVAFFDCTGPAGQLYGVARSIAAEAFWNGVGGDGVFLQIPHVVTALGGRSVLRSLLRALVTACDAARYSSDSLLGVLRTMMQERRRPSPTRPYVLDLFAPYPRLPFLARDVLAAGIEEPLLHPLLECGDSNDKAKYFHILASCFKTPAFYDPWQSLPDNPFFDDGLEHVSPLLSQPVVEACLRIPATLLIRGGIDRSLARSTFADVLAPRNVRRMSKSNPTALYEDVVARNIDLIRDTLIEGSLASTGILDRKALEGEFFGGDRPSRRAVHAALDLFNWEAWTRSWR